ncbi:MAG: KTSC domain-containing protein [Gloeobacteraceae cyanobacterium ES-bin-316]|nr:KTSC domain-containing protein [Ferruginibacter sp.]
MPSTVIRLYEYLPEKELLIIHFVTGKRYQYSGVTQSEYDGFYSSIFKRYHY